METERIGELLFIYCCLLREEEPTLSISSPGSGGSQPPQNNPNSSHSRPSPVCLRGKDEYSRDPTGPWVSICPLNAVCSWRIRGLHMFQVSCLDYTYYCIMRKTDTPSTLHQDMVKQTFSNEFIKTKPINLQCSSNTSIPVPASSGSLPPILKVNSARDNPVCSLVWWDAPFINLTSCSTFL